MNEGDIVDVEIRDCAIKPLSVKSEERVDGLDEENPDQSEQINSEISVGEEGTMTDGVRVMNMVAKRGLE